MTRMATDPVTMPARLEDLQGTTHGVVTLPIHLDWTLQFPYQLADPMELRSMYSTLVREARRVDDLERFLDEDTLVAEWSRLNLPVYVRTVWEARFPELLARTSHPTGPGGHA